MKDNQTHIGGKAITSIIANAEIIQEGTRAKYKAQIIQILVEDAKGPDKGLSGDCMAIKIGCKPGSVCACIRELHEAGIIIIVGKERRPEFQKLRHIYKLAKQQK